MTTDDDLIDDYLANRLDEQQLESFEIELLDNAELQRAVLSQRALKQGLAGQNASVFKKKSPPFRLTEWLTRPTWAYAATILLGISVTAHWLRTDGGRSPQIDRIVYLETVRGADGPSYRLNRGEGNLLVVDVNPASTGPYLISIARQDRIVEQQRFPRATNYSLKIVLPELPAATYTLRLDDGQNTNEFTFEVAE